MEHNSDFIAKKIQNFSGKQPPKQIKNISIEIQSKNTSYRVIRLNDKQYVMLGQNSISIADDDYFLMSLYSKRKFIFHSLSKMYATLKHLFEESGDCYDDWKGSFSFPFLVSFERNGEEFDYLMNIHNVRSGIEFSLRKLIKADDKNFDVMIRHKPFPEFKIKQINDFLICFIGYLTDYYEANKLDYEAVFYKTVQSNLIIFGHKNGEFFDWQCDDPDEFEAEIKKLKKVK